MKLDCRSYRQRLDDPAGARSERHGDSRGEFDPGTADRSARCVESHHQHRFTVTVENNAPYATLTVSNNAILVGQTVTVSYKSNIAGCTLGENRVGTQAQGIFLSGLTGGDSEGTRIYSGGNAGATQLTFSCGAIGGNPTVVSATPQTVAVYQPVSASVSAPADAVTDEPFTVSWETTDATSCTPSGGGADGASWSGSVTLPSGQQSITPSVVGTFTYTLTCVGQIPSDTTTAQATIKVAVVPPQPAGSSDSGGKGSGGGGAFDGLTLAMLGLATALRGRRRIGSPL